MEALFIFLLVISVFFFLGKKEKMRGRKKQPKGRKKNTRNSDLLASITIAPDKKLFKRAEKPLNDLIASYLSDKSKTTIRAVTKKIISCVGSGFRTESISKVLIREFNIQEELASTIAGHGSGFLMAKYHQYKATDIGITKYKWLHIDIGAKGCQHDFLDGRIFEFNNPPVIDGAGNRAHPGETYPCICQAISIIE